MQCLWQFVRASRAEGRKNGKEDHDGEPTVDASIDDFWCDCDHEASHDRHHARADDSDLRGVELVEIHIEEGVLN